MGGPLNNTQLDETTRQEAEAALRKFGFAIPEGAKTKEEINDAFDTFVSTKAEELQEKGFLEEANFYKRTQGRAQIILPKKETPEEDKEEETEDDKKKKEQEEGGFNVGEAFGDDDDEEDEGTKIGIDEPATAKKTVEENVKELNKIREELEKENATRTGNEPQIGGKPKTSVITGNEPALSEEGNKILAYQRLQQNKTEEELRKTISSPNEDPAAKKAAANLLKNIRSDPNENKTRTNAELYRIAVDKSQKAQFREDAKKELFSKLSDGQLTQIITDNKTDSDFRNEARTTLFNKLSDRDLARIAQDERAPLDFRKEVSAEFQRRSPAREEKFNTSVEAFRKDIREKSVDELLKIMNDESLDPAQSEAAAKILEFKLMTSPVDSKTIEGYEKLYERASASEIAEYKRTAIRRRDAAAIQALNKIEQKKGIENQSRIVQRVTSASAEAPLAQQSALGSDQIGNTYDILSNDSPLNTTAEYEKRQRERNSLLKGPRVSTRPAPIPLPQVTQKKPFAPNARYAARQTLYAFTFDHKEKKEIPLNDYIRTLYKNRREGRAGILNTYGLFRKLDAEGQSAILADGIQRGGAGVWDFITGESGKELRLWRKGMIQTIDDKILAHRSALKLANETIGSLIRQKTERGAEMIITKQIGEWRRQRARSLVSIVFQSAIRFVLKPIEGLAKLASVPKNLISRASMAIENSRVAQVVRGAGRVLAIPGHAIEAIGEAAGPAVVIGLVTGNPALGIGVGAVGATASFIDKALSTPNSIVGNGITKAFGIEGSGQYLTKAGGYAESFWVSKAAGGAGGFSGGQLLMKAVKNAPLYGTIGMFVGPLIGITSPIVAIGVGAGVGLTTEFGARSAVNALSQEGNILHTLKLIKMPVNELFGMYVGSQFVTDQIRLFDKYNQAGKGSQYWSDQWLSAGASMNYLGLGGLAWSSVGVANWAGGVFGRMLGPEAMGGNLGNAVGRAIAAGGEMSLAEINHLASLPKIASGAGILGSILGLGLGIGTALLLGLPIGGAAIVGATIGTVVGVAVGTGISLIPAATPFAFPIITATTTFFTWLGTVAGAYIDKAIQNAAKGFSALLASLGLLQFLSFFSNIMTQPLRKITDYAELGITGVMLIAAISTFDASYKSVSTNTPVASDSSNAQGFLTSAMASVESAWTVSDVSNSNQRLKLSKPEDLNVQSCFNDEEDKYFEFSEGSYEPVNKAFGLTLEVKNDYQLLSPIKGEVIYIGDNGLFVKNKKGTLTASSEQAMILSPSQGDFLIMYEGIEPTFSEGDKVNEGTAIGLATGNFRTTILPKEQNVFSVSNAISPCEKNSDLGFNGFRCDIILDFKDTCSK